MTPDLMPNRDEWQHLLTERLEALPALATDQVRLFRIQSSRSVTPSPWIAQMQGENGMAAASGRWFSSHPDALAFYAEDVDHPELVTLDVSSTEAEACRLTQLPAVLADGSRPRAFSRDPETEHFVPSEWKTRQRRWSLGTDEVAVDRRRRLSR